MAANKSTDQNPIISRGLDKRNTPDKTRKGYAQEMYNMDTNTSGYIEKRKGYQHSREVPIRVTKVTNAGSEIELTVSNSLDTSLLTPGPVVISQYTEAGNISFYYPTYENLSNFTIEGGGTVSVAHTRGLDIAIDLLQQFTDNPNFVENILPNYIRNRDIGGGNYEVEFDFPDYTADDLFTPIVPDLSQPEELWSKTKFDFVSQNGTALVVDDGNSVGNVAVSGDTCTVTVELDNQVDFEVPFSNYIWKLLKIESGYQTQIIADSGEVTLDGSNDRTFTMVFKDELNPADQYVILLYSIDDNIGGEATVIQDIVPVVDDQNPNDQVIEITGVSTRYNINALYEIDTLTGTQRKVLANEVTYDADTETLTCKYSIPSSENTEVKFVRFPSVPIVAGISVTNPATDSWSDVNGLDEPNMTLNETDVSGTWIYGFSQDEILSVGNAVKYREVKKLDEWSGQTFNKLLAIALGDVWNDSPEIENAQYFPSSDVVLQDIQGAQTQTVYPFFGTAQTQGKTRGVEAANIDDSCCIDILSITNNKDQTFTVTFDLGAVSAGDVTTLALGQDILSIENCELANYNGNFVVSAVTTNSITVNAPELQDYIRSLSTSGGTKATITTDYITLNGTPSAKVGDAVNLITDSVVCSIDGSNLWMSGISFSTATTVQAAVPVTYARMTDVLPLNNTNWFVKGDLGIATGYERKFKILSVDPDNSTITIDESILITGRAGQITNIKLDGRLILSRTPVNNVNLDLQTFPDPKAQYRVGAGSLSNSVFLSNNIEPIQKFDGESILDAGILNWPIRSNSWIEESSNTGLLPQSFTFTDSTSASEVLTCAFPLSMPDLSDLPNVGGRIDVSISGTIYSGTLKSYDASAKEIVLEGLTGLADAADNNGSFYIPTSYRYYLRLESVDRNRQVSIGPTTGLNETKITIYSPSIIRHKATLFPPESMRIEWSRLKFKLFRTLGYPAAGADLAIFYPILTQRLPSLQGLEAKDTSFSGSSVVFEDVVPDASIDRNSSDRVSTVLKGIELPQAITLPPKSDHIANVGNKMVYAGIKSAPTLAVGFEDLLGYSTSVNSFTRTAVCLTKITGSVNWRNNGDLRLVFYNTPDNTGEVLQVQGADLIASGVNSISAVSLGTDVNNDYYADLTFDDTTLATEYSAWANGVTDYIQVVGKGNVAAYGELAGHFRVASATSNGASSSVRIYIGKSTYDKLNGGSYNTDSLSVVIAVGTSGGVYKPNGATNIAVVPLLSRVTGDEITHDQTAIADGYGIAKNRLGLDLGRAINDVMRQQDLYTKYSLPHESSALIDTTPMEGFCQARWGDVVGYNNLVIESFKDEVEFAVDYANHDQSSAINNVAIFINGYAPERQTASTNSALEPEIDYTNSITDITSRPAVFNSRVILSYDNYPDIVDNPFTLSPLESDSIVDVAADDGQSITGVSGFFGVSAGENTSLSSYILVFKESSVYVIDSAQRTAKKLETWGQGCTLPESITAVDGRVFFANDTGVYVINRDLTAAYVGQNIEAYWKDNVNKKGDAVGFIDSLDRKYKLSVSVGDSTQTDEAVVYDFIKTPETPEGSWVTYNNIASRSWRETTEGVFYGSYEGKIFSIRNVGDKTDYRDDTQGINASWTYGAQSFGDKSTRVTVNRVFVYFDGTEGITDLKPSDSTDFDTFQEMNEVDRLETKSIYAIGLSPTERTAQFYQFKLEHGTKDENLIVTSVDFKFTSENALGTEQANKY